MTEFGKRDLADLLVKLAICNNISEETLVKVTEALTPDIEDWSKPKESIQ